MEVSRKGFQKVGAKERLIGLFQSRRWEHSYPYVIGIAVGVAFWFSDLQFPSGNLLFSATLTLASLFVGFLATTASILLGLDSDVMRRVRASSYISDLASYLEQALATCFLLIAVAIIGFFVESPSGLFGAIWVTVLVMAALAVLRLVQILIGFLQHPA